jgi:general stress protein 26
MTANTTDKREHLVAVLKDFDTGMLFTRTDEGNMRGRPMALAEVQPNGNVYLCSSLGSGKQKELEADQHAALSVQGKTKFASISGRAKVTQDRALIAKLWKEDWKVWFPEGKDDPNLSIIEFNAEEGEYWDNSGVHGVRFVVKAAKAYLSGERYDDKDQDINAKVHL